jgi:hypothetical protein
MIEVFKEPVLGQYVQMWEYKGNIYSETLRKSPHGRHLQVLDVVKESWFYYDGVLSNECEVRYFISE